MNCAYGANSTAMNMLGCECTGPSATGCGGPKCITRKKNLLSDQQAILNRLDEIISLLQKG